MATWLDQYKWFYGAPLDVTLANIGRTEREKHRACRPGLLGRWAAAQLWASPRTLRELARIELRKGVHLDDSPHTWRGPRPRPDTRLADGEVCPDCDDQVGPGVRCGGTSR
jgi:hypothetical protein